MTGKPEKDINKACFKQAEKRTQKAGNKSIVQATSGASRSTKIVGTYKGNGPYADSFYVEIQSDHDGNYDGYLTIASPSCIGTIDGAKGELSPGGGILTFTRATPDSLTPCVIAATIGKDGSMSLAERTWCGYFHGAACGFDGSVKKVSSKTPTIDKARADPGAVGRKSAAPSAD